MNLPGIHFCTREITEYLKLNYTENTTCQKMWIEETVQGDKGSANSRDRDENCTKREAQRYAEHPPQG